MFTLATGDLITGKLVLLLEELYPGIKIVELVMWAFLFHGNYFWELLDLPGYQYFHLDFLGIPRKVIRGKLGRDPNSREMPADVSQHLVDIVELRLRRDLEIVEPNGLHLAIAQSCDVIAIVATLTIGQHNTFAFDGTVKGTDHTTNLGMVSSEDPNALTELQRMEKVCQLWVFGRLPNLFIFHSLYVNGYFGETHALF